MNKRFTSLTTEQLSVIGILLVSCLVILPKNFTAIPATGIDSSWAIAINLAHKESLVFGKDFVFTYGPLGFLTTRFDYAIGYFPFILADLFIVTLLIYCLRIVWRKTNSVLVLLTIPYSIYLISLNHEIGFVYYTFFFFLILHYFYENNWLSLLLAGILTILMFFLKFNTGLVSMLVLQLLMAYKLPWSTSRWMSSCLIWVSPIVMIYLLSFTFNIDLKGYIIGGLVIVNYYNDAMASADAIQNSSRLSYFSFFFVAIVVSALSYFLLRNIRHILSDFVNIALTLFLLLSLYISWKQGFTRYDPIRNGYFFFYAILFIGTCSLYTKGKFQEGFKKLFILLLLISPFITTGSGPTFNNFSLPYQDLFLKSSKVREQQYSEFKRTLALDDRTTELIGKQSVDIFPDEITYAFYNDLTYNPRPAIQSYQAYSEYLTHLNYQKYISERAPEFILAKTTMLDMNRYSLWTDSQAWLAMLQHYDYQYMGRDSLIVLQKNDSIRTLHQTTLVDTQIQLDQTFDVPTQGIALPYLKAEVNYSLWGKLCRFLVRPPALYIRVWYDNNTTQLIKAILPELKGGVLLKQVNSSQEMATFFSTKGTKNPSVQKIQVLGSPLNFSKSIPIQISSIQID